MNVNNHLIGKCVSEFVQCLWDQVQEGGREEIQKKQRVICL